MVSVLGMEPSVERSPDVEPDIRALLDNPGPAGPDLFTSTPEEIRAHYVTTRNPESVAEVAEVVDTSFQGPAGPVAVRIYRADAEVAHAPTLLWFHGGGWVVGDIYTAELPARAMASDAQCTVISVDYRLAPETKFPGGYNDCLASLKWVRDNAPQLRVDLSRLVVGGDSAGGNLAAAVAIDDRNTGGALAGQLLIYPVVEAEPDWSGRDDRDEDFLLSGATMDWFFEQYLSDDADRSDWRLAPSTADLAGTAPAFVQTCGFDLLAAEGLRYAAKLSDAGVNVTIDHLPGAVHATFAMEVAAGVRGRSSAAAWLRRIF